MAQKFGGKYSPSGAQKNVRGPIDEPTFDPVGLRVYLLLGPPVVILFTSLNDGPGTLIAGVISVAVLTLAVWLLRDGLRAEAAFQSRKVARRPAIPRKMMASALTGIGTAIAAYAGDLSMISAAIYGVAATALHSAAFGIDPLRSKGMEGIDTFQQDRVARVVEQAEGHLSVVKSQIEALKDRPLEIRVGTFLKTARHMIRIVEEDPRDLTQARKFLSVYLEGARDATIKFADLYRRRRDPSVRADYEALLTDLENNFAARTEKMMLDDRSDMDIEIKVLRDRLQREGVKPE